MLKSSAQSGLYQGVFLTGFNYDTASPWMSWFMTMDSPVPRSSEKIFYPSSFFLAFCTFWTRLTMSIDEALSYFRLVVGIGPVGSPSTIAVSFELLIRWSGTI